MNAPVEIRPRHSNSREENVREAVQALIASPLAPKVAEFLIGLDQAQDKLKAGQLEEHPLTHALKEVGADVHWTN